MGQSLYKIAEQCRQLTEKRVSIQVLIPAVIDAYGYVAKKSWYESQAQDSQEIEGSFISTFTDLQPVLDITRDLYYIILPSTYLILPHEIGIQWVSLMKERTSWVRVQNWGIFNNLKAAVMGGRGVYEIEGNRMYFPKMTNDTVCPMLLKLAIAYDALDPYEQLNIGPNMVNDIIGIVTAPYMNKQNPIEKIREIIN